LQALRGNDKEQRQLQYVLQAAYSMLHAACRVLLKQQQLVLLLTEQHHKET